MPCLLILLVTDSGCNACCVSIGVDIWGRPGLPHTGVVATHRSGRHLTGEVTWRAGPSTRPRRLVERRFAWIGVSPAGACDLSHVCGACGVPA
ncbi:MAG: hypothetical protein QG661_3285 [Actinomycetota bacterium]|nr:hypothetical protein [Actinomycetota bacterium]